LDELDSMLGQKDKSSLLESRATHVMQSAINLLNYITANYDKDIALELERRLLNGIRNRDVAKFARSVRKIDNEDT
tara:strand:+ start:13052 stop:13279 length:228 start_codon:yes stop_codon:yes gene_type:complete